MPLLTIARSIASLLSLLLLALAVYLLWQWHVGRDVVVQTGAVVHVQDAWKLWTGLGLIAWSFLGRFPILALIAHRDRHPVDWSRGDGALVPGTEGKSLYVETAGREAAPTLVFTHGWSMDSTMWAAAKRDLADRFRLVLWDLPGLGRSTRGDNARIGLPEFAQDLRTVIERSGSAPVVLVGHSIGGMTIQTLARDNPELFGTRIAGVVLLNTTFTNPLKTMILSGLAQAIRWPLLEPMFRLTILLSPLARLSAWQSYLSGSTHLSMRLGFGRSVSYGQLDHVALLTTKASPAVSARGDLAMFRWDATGALAQAGVPVLVIAGDMDIVTKEEASAAIVAATPDARLHVVDGANHMGPIECAGAYNTAIAAFVTALRPREAHAGPSIVPATA